MLGPIPAHRAVAIAAVLLLHLLLIWLFLNFQTVTAVAPVFREQAITLWLTPPPKPKPPAPRTSEKEKDKQIAPSLRALGQPAPVAPAAPEASDYNGLRALGRYLNNCSGAEYEKLSAKELAHCLGNQWNGPDRGEAALRLGIEPPSKWKAQMDKKKAPVAPIEQECAQGTLNSNLGLPCFNFGN